MMVASSNHRENAMIRTSLLTCALAVAALPAFATEVTFEVAGIASAEGHVMVALYDEGSFLKKPLAALRLKPSGGSVSGTFGDVPAGVYAAVAFHDENGNGRLDFNPMGIPLEKTGFSRDAQGVMGPPSFADSKFEVNGAATAIIVTLR
jgi:uncharacterized protein (DUF2141 family)